ncbi:MAG: CbtA family protein [Reyranella sp.]|uniref:CbtA family protein n=1 Tax=Reyranella sp. TaxID=1929291 RepID=UPI003D0C751C
MLARVMSVGLLAGLLAGLVIALVQQVTTTPLILLAESYEKSGTPPTGGATSGAPASGAAHSHGGGASEHAHGDAWEPAAGLPRFFYTGIMTIATAVGVCFLLLAGMLIAGDPIDERHSLAWAVAGFVASGLAPAAGLAPELPGSASGALVARQLWWIGTVAATALALWVFVRMENPLPRLGAVFLLMAPHVIGAPHPHEFESRVPAEVAAQFAALSLVVQGLLWACAGVAVGWLWPRLAPRPAGRVVAS